MAHGDFIWCDLSTFHPAQTQAFYTSVFGWQFSGEGYAIAHRADHPVAALYEMPEKFQNIKMPSFWMSYIAVDDVAQTVARATELGGKVEVGPTPFDGGGQFALIRDPLGAGFTVYEGTALDGALTGAGGRLGHELFVSDASAVIPFYTGLFGWQISAAQGEGHAISHAGRIIAYLHEVPDPAIRGKEQYWAIVFDTAGAPLEAFAQRVTQAGGQAVAQVELPDGPAMILRDPDGAAFFVRAAQGKDAPVGTPQSGLRHWRSILGLALIGLAFVTGWAWIGAVFSAVWVTMGLRDRATYLLEPVTRDAAPVLYWLILLSFAALGVAALAGY